MVFTQFLILFFLGLAVGSFLNCVIYRLETGQSFLKGRSFCPHCKHTLLWKDLIPVFSFIFLKGKCRYCGEKISLQYPLVELVTGIIFVLIFHFSISNFQSAIYNLIISCFLIIIFVFDLRHSSIPDKIIYSAILVTGIWYLVFGILGQYPIYEIKTKVFTALGTFLFFLAIYFISRGKWLGFGDVNLAFLLGMILSWPKIIIALFLAFLMGAVIGLVLIFLGKKNLKSQIPFAPFLVSGTFLAIFFGEKIINWYLALILLK